MRVNGPYIHFSGKLKGRKYVNLLYEDGRRTTMLYSRWLMEEHLGRKLTRGEHVDHVDEDPTNDSLENLQILSPSDNAKKSARLRRPVEMVEFICPVCHITTEREARHVRRNKKLGKAGPFCGKVCAGRWR